MSPGGTAEVQVNHPFGTYSAINVGIPALSRRATFDCPCRGNERGDIRRLPNIDEYLQTHRSSRKAAAKRSVQSAVAWIAFDWFSRLRAACELESQIARPACE